jgi:hypothetical protein
LPTANFTPFGRNLRYAGRISGVSITIPIIGEDRKPMCLAYGESYLVRSGGAKDVKGASIAHLSSMGGVLIDGVVSALQP